MSKFRSFPKEKNCRIMLKSAHTWHAIFFSAFHLACVFFRSLFVLLWCFLLAYFRYFISQQNKYGNVYRNQMVLGLLPSTKFSSKNYIHLTMAYVEKSMTASVKEDNIQIIHSHCLEWRKVACCKTKWILLFVS